VLALEGGVLKHGRFSFNLPLRVKLLDHLFAYVLYLLLEDPLVVFEKQRMLIVVNVVFHLEILSYLFL